MPTQFELNEMYVQQGAIGGFGPNAYWNNTRLGNDFWYQNFVDGYIDTYYSGGGSFLFRTVRSF